MATGLNNISPPPGEWVIVTALVDRPALARLCRRATATNYNCRILYGRRAPNLSTTRLACPMNSRRWYGADALDSMTRTI
jgi:hypothetical protein